jgi:hypothetical protein
MMSYHAELSSMELVGQRARSVLTGVFKRWQCAEHHTCVLDCGRGTWAESDLHHPNPKTEQAVH